jgi:hypothetical protein
MWAGDLAAADGGFEQARALGYNAGIRSKAYIVFLLRTERYAALDALLRGLKLAPDWVDAFVSAMQNPDDRSAAVQATLTHLEQIPTSLRFGVWTLLQETDRALDAFDYALTSPDVEFLWTPESSHLRDHPDFPALLQRLGLNYVQD